MAAHDASESFPTASETTVPVDRVDRILAARRMESASPDEESAERRPVKHHDRNEKLPHDSSVRASGQSPSGFRPPLQPDDMQCRAHRWEEPLILRKLQRLVRTDHHHQIIAARKIVLQAAERLAQQSPNPIPTDRDTDFPRRAQPKATYGGIIRDAIQHERPARHTDARLKNRGILVTGSNAQAFRKGKSLGHDRNLAGIRSEAKKRAEARIERNSK
jgi:hypothetical protein